MKWLARLLLIGLSIALLSSCGGTATGNPGNSPIPDGGQNAACDPDPFVCPDGTLVYRQGASCEFDACP